MTLFLLWDFIYHKRKRPQNIGKYADALRSSLVVKKVGKEDGLFVFI